MTNDGAPMPSPSRAPEAITETVETIKPRLMMRSAAAPARTVSSFCVKGLMSASGIAALMFEALYDAKINIQMISTSEIKVSVLIEKGYADQAVQAIHNKFFG